MKSIILIGKKRLFLLWIGVSKMGHQVMFVLCQLRVVSILGQLKYDSFNNRAKILRSNPIWNINGLPNNHLNTYIFNKIFIKYFHRQKIYQYSKMYIYM